jgi:hypothetical protein
VRFVDDEVTVEQVLIGISSVFSCLSSCHFSIVIYHRLEKCTIALTGQIIIKSAVFKMGFGGFVSEPAFDGYTARKFKYLKKIAIFSSNYVYYEEYSKSNWCFLIRQPGYYSAPNSKKYIHMYVFK